MAANLVGFAGWCFSGSSTPQTSVSPMTNPVKWRDLSAAQDSARTFRRAALALLEAAPEGIGDGSRQASGEALGSIVCAATNLALALELYLKAAHICARTGFNRKTHFLDEIYSDLPKTERTNVRGKYDSLLDQLPDDQIQFINLARGQIVPPAWKDRVRQRDGLLPMLHRSRDVFVSWRYVFEIELPLSAQHQMIRFEHSLMNVACEALERHLREA
jgi:hypothetical protein